MLPHDALTMSCQDEDLNVHVEAASSDDCPRPDVGLWPACRWRPNFSSATCGKKHFRSPSAPYWRERIDARGYRSLLRVAIPARDRLVGVAFWSKQAHAYDSRHRAARPPNRRPSRRRGLVTNAWPTRCRRPYTSAHARSRLTATRESRPRDRASGRTTSASSESLPNGSRC